MANNVAVGFTFQTQPGPIPLSQLDSNLNQLQVALNSLNSFSNYLLDTSGAANTITVGIVSPLVASVTAGLEIQVQVANTNSIPGVQLNFNGTGNKAVINANGAALLVGQIVAGQICILQYDGTAWRLTGSGGSGVLSITGTANQIAASASTGAVTLSLPSVVTTPGDLIVSQGLQVQGTGTTGFSGPGVEMFCTGALGGLQAYNRTGAAFIPLGISGSTVTLNYGAAASPALSINTTGNITINQPSGTGITLDVTGNATAGNPVAIFRANTSAGNSRGVQVLGGTTNTDFCCVFANAANTQNLMLIYGDGGSVLGSATGGDQGLGTLNVAGGYYVNGVFQPSVITSRAATTETRTSTTTLTNSTQLTMALSLAGTYAIHIVFPYSTAGTAGIGAAVGVNYSGTFTAASSTVGGNGPTTGSGQTITSTVNSPLFASNAAGNTSTPQYWIIDGTLTVTGAGTLSVAFAQNASSATSTTLLAGAYMVASKLP